MELQSHAASTPAQANPDGPLRWHSLACLLRFACAGSKLSGMQQANSIVSVLTSRWELTGLGYRR